MSDGSDEHPRVIESLVPLLTAIDDVRVLEGNPRKGDVNSVARSLDRFKQRKPIVARAASGEIIAGNHTWLAAKKLGWDSIAVVFVDDDDTTAQAYALADNRTSELGSFDNDALTAMIQNVLDEDAELLYAASYTEDDLDALLQEAQPSDLDEEDEVEEPSTRSSMNLFDRFMVPPFSVLNAREGWWQDRKKAWINLGIEGELGREDKPRTWYIAPPRSQNSDPLVDPQAAEERRKGDE